MRKLRTLLIALLVVSLLPISGATAESPTLLKIGYLTWAGIPADMDKVEQYVNDNILIPKLNVMLEMVPINGGSYGQQANMFLNDGAVDLLQLFGQNFWTLVSNGQITPMNDLLDQYGQGIKEAIDPTLWWGCQVEDETYCVPLLSRAYGIDYAVYCREDLCEKYNITTERFETVAELEEVLAMIKEKEPDILPIAANGSFLGHIVTEPDGTVYSNTGDYYCGAVSEDIEDGMKVINYYASDEYLRRVNIARDWYLKGYVDENVHILTAEDTENVWKNNGAFCRLGLYAPGFGVPPVNSRRIALGTQSEPRTGTAEISVFGWMIPSTSRNAEKAMQLLNEIFTNQELATALQWGIEGEHYVKTGKDDREIRYPDGVTSDTVTYSNDQNYAFGDFFGGLYMEGTAPNYDDICKQFNDAKVKDTYLGFAMDMEFIKTPVASVSAVVSQYDPLLGCGAVDPATTLPQFLSALEGAGINMCIEEFQRQLDEYVKKNPDRFIK